MQSSSIHAGTFKSRRMANKARMQAAQKNITEKIHSVVSASTISEVSS